jgi:hypothetical protein
VEEENHDDDDNDTKSSCALSIGVRGNPLKACSVSLLIAFPLDKLRRKINSPSASPSSQDNSANSLTDAVHVCVCEEIMESKSDIVGVCVCARRDHGVEIRHSWVANKYNYPHLSNPTLFRVWVATTIS